MIGRRPRCEALHGVSLTGGNHHHLTEQASKVATQRTKAGLEVGFVDCLESLHPSFEFIFANL